MSCPERKPSGRLEPGAVAGELPTHNWRPTVVHGAALWLLVGVAAALPLGGAFGFGLAVVAVFVVPVFPVALCCDYRQARALGECAPGVVAYGKNLGHDLLTTLVYREPLGSDRGLLDC